MNQETGKEKAKLLFNAIKGKQEIDHFNTILLEVRSRTSLYKTALLINDIELKNVAITGLLKMVENLEPACSELLNLLNEAIDILTESGSQMIDIKNTMDPDFDPEE